MCLDLLTAQFLSSYVFNFTPAAGESQWHFLENQSLIKIGSNPIILMGFKLLRRSKAFSTKGFEVFEEFPSLE